MPAQAGQCDEDVGAKGPCLSSSKNWRTSSYRWRTLTVLAALSLAISPGWADDGPFLTAITPQMQEPGSLEVATKSITANPGGGNRFLGVATEFEFGLTSWWTIQVTPGVQATQGEGGRFIGYEWENRLRLLKHEHWINPVLSVEFESISGQDETLLDEVTGRDGSETLSGSNPATLREMHREIEAQLILGSSFMGWTIAENFTTEKDVGHAPFEFGYAVGISRSLALVANPCRCAFCAQAIQLAAEMYGGLGTHDDFGLRRTAQYIAPVVAWTIANGTTFRVAPGFGLTHASAPLALRFGVSYEIDKFGRTVRNLLRGQTSTTRLP